MRMTMDRMMKSDKDYSEPKYQSGSRKRKPSDPITKADVVKGSFEGTSSDRAALTKKLKDKIEKLIDQGYEKNVPSNWKDVLSHNDGDTLHALSKVVFPGFFGTLKRTLFPEGITIERQLRRIIREERAKVLAEQKPSEMSMHDAAEYYEKQRSTSMGQTAKADELFDARDALLGILETIEPDQAGPYIEDLIRELQMMQREM